MLPNMTFLAARDDTVALAERNERKRWVRRGIARLRPRQRDILHARYWAGRKLRDIGGELGISEAGAYQRIAAARRALRGILVGG